MFCEGEDESEGERDGGEGAEGGVKGCVREGVV